MEGTFGKILILQDKAIKCQKLVSNEGFIYRQALKEACCLKNLDHKNIISIYKIYIRDEFLFIKMDKYKKFRVDKIKDKEDIMIQLLEGLIYMHDRDIIHGDIKPGNIMMDNDIVKYIDYGSAVFGNSTMDMSTTYVYAAPEVMTERLTCKESDIWSLGCLFLEIYEKKPIKAIITDIKDEEYYSVLPNYVKQKYPDNFILNNMLQKSKEKRITARQLYNIMTHKNLPFQINKTIKEYNITYPMGKVTFMIKEYVIRMIKNFTIYMI